MTMNQSYIDLLKSYRLSITPVRLAVLQALESHPHADADKIYNIVREDIATTSKQAIYNNLNVMVEHGLLREIRPKGQSSLYETRVNDNHHHIVCRTCNAVMDTDCFTHAPCLEPMETHGFAIDEAEVIFWGTCPDCQKTDTNETNSMKRREAYE